VSTRRPQVFYSFHFDNDVFRVQQIRNIGVIDGNEPVSRNEWETARKTPGAIERWIDDNMKYKSHVVVLVGAETSERPWVRYEIVKAWNEGRGLLGIFIHNLRDPRTAAAVPYYGRCSQGRNPFAEIRFENGLTMAQYVPCFDPRPSDAYQDIAQNLLGWIARGARRT